MTSMTSITIYVERSGGRWEARYWHADERRYFRFSDIDIADALRKAARHAGYAVDRCRIVRS